MKSNFIEFSIKSTTGMIKLNRPDSLNALNFDMVNEFYDQLLRWKQDETIKQILLFGHGKGLCAGGDVKSLFLSSNKNNLKKKFFKIEYRLNNAINEFTKPHLSIWDGIVMGGGIGLSIYGNMRLATEKAKFAMPETAIGFFPDVGGSYFLSRLQKGIGLYIGLTGKACNARDLMDLGLATHYFPSNELSPTIEKYIEEENLNQSNYYPEMSSEITENKNFIEDTFIGNIDKIMNILKNTSIEFGKQLYHHLLTRCPMSLVVTARLIEKAKNKSLQKCLEMEYQLCQHMVYRNDFNNGVDAILVSKNHKPKWHPKSLKDINVDEVEKLFKFHTENILI